MPGPGRKSEVATAPMPSRGPRSGRKSYSTPALLGVPNGKRGEKIRFGCFTLAFSTAHKWAELLRNPYVLGGPETRRQNQNWLPHPCLLGGPKRGSVAA